MPTDETAMWIPKGGSLLGEPLPSEGKGHTLESFRVRQFFLIFSAI
jgi:hypothetical protein